MAVNKKWKAELKERIRLSNERVAVGLSPDPWVVEFRKKNNAIKAAWKAKQPKKEDKRIANSGSFKPGLIPHNKKTEAENKASLAKWREGTKEWHKKNKDRINELARIRRQNIGTRLKCNLRKRLSFLVRKKINGKTKQTMAIVGCSIEDLLKHLSGLFQEGMTFENYGKWHIDHILPCDSFDFSNPEEVEKCFHYTNLQPLWALDNRMKSNKIERQTA